MGQFSWIYSDTNNQLIDNKPADTYLLVQSHFRRNTARQSMNLAMMDMEDLETTMCMI